jgi:adenylate cyclase
VLSRQACRAALDVLDAVRDFNSRRGRHELPTRVGLAAGEVLLGNVGAGTRYEYRAVGDIVSTASRIQGLNRMLGTEILVSEDAVATGGDCLTRDVGTFLLRGKATALRIHELLGIGEQPRLDDRSELAEHFAQALSVFRDGSWREAERRFRALGARFPNDGPTRYYRDLSASYDAHPPTDWRGVIAVTIK